MTDGYARVIADMERRIGNLERRTFDRGRGGGGTAEVGQVAATSPAVEVTLTDGLVQPVGQIFGGTPIVGDDALVVTPVDGEPVGVFRLAAEWTGFTPYVWQGAYIDQVYSNAVYCYLSPGLLHMMVEVQVEAGGALGSALGVFPPDGFRMDSSTTNFSTYCGGSYIYERRVDDVRHYYSGSVFVDFGFIWLADWSQGETFRDLGDRWTPNDDDVIWIHCTLPYVIQDPSVTWGP